MALGAVGDEELTERVGARHRPRGAGDGRQRGLRPVRRPRDRTAATRRSASARSATTRTPSAGTARRWSAASSRPASPPRPSTSRASARGARTRTTRLGVVDAAAETSTPREFAPFRAAIAAGAAGDVGPRRGAGATGDADLPATLSRAVMTGLLRDELGFDGLTISDALDMRALAQGAGPGGRRHRGDPRRHRPAARARPTAGPAPDRGDARARAAARGLFDAGRTGRLERAPGRRFDLARGRRATRPTSTSSARPSTGPSSRELAERSMTTARRATTAADCRCRLRARRRRILAVMPRPTDLTPADTSSSVAPGLGRALRDAVRLGRRFRRRPVAPTRRRDRRACERAPDRRCRRRRDDRRRIEPAQVGARRAIAATGTPTVAVAMRTPLDVAVYPAGVPALATYSILPDRWTRWPRALAGESGFAGPAPGRPSTAVGVDDAPRRDPRAARGRGPVPRDAAPRSSSRSRRRSARAARRPRRHRRPRHLATMPRSTPSTCSVSGTGCRSGSGRRRSSRSTAPSRGSSDALVIGISQSGASPDIVAVIAAGRAPRAPRRSPSRTSPTSAARGRRGAGRSTSAPARNGRSPRRRRTPPSSSRSPLLSAALSRTTRPIARPSRRIPDTLARGARRSSPRSSAIAADQAAADRAARRRPRLSSTRPRASGRSSSRSWPGSSPIPYSAADFQHGPLALVEPGVPVLAVVRSGRRPGTASSTLLGRLRDGSRRRPDGRLAIDAAGARARDAGRSRLPAGTPEWLGPIVVDRRRGSSTRCT